MPKLKGLKPMMRRIDERIDVNSDHGPLPGTDLTTDFAVRWTGYLHIATIGTRTLALSSDDGSRLTVDGKVEIRNGGNHGANEEVANLTLTAGDHPIMIEYFQGSVTFSCRLSDKTDGGRVLDGHDLLHHPDPTLDQPAGR